MIARNELPLDIQRLIKIHTYKRPHKGKTVHEFVDHMLLDPYESAYVIYDDDNKTPLSVVISTSDTSRTLFSAHVDTVHRTDGRQRVVYDHDMLLMSKSQDKATNDNECLGADDGAGIWLLLEMIDAGVPGTYVFHYGEEVGGIGSSGMAEGCASWLQQFDRAIAFDRKGTDDIITHQGWSRCCSDTFAETLAMQLNMAGSQLAMRPDDGGIFTDTANYTKLIPECTNISCGYDGAHTNGESLDVEFLLRLRDACLQVEWDELPTIRDVNEVDELYQYPWHSASAWTGFGKNKSSAVITPESTDDLLGMTHSQIVTWVKNTHSAEVADLVSELIDRLAFAEDELGFATTQHDDDDDTFQGKFL